MTTTKGDYDPCPLQKNQILTLRIERLSSDGSGVAHSPDGETVFVPVPPGDEADVRIVKDCKRYAFGILDHLRTPSPDRIPVDCAVAGPCGGCSLRHLDYTAELRAKQENVTDAFRRIGGLDVPVLDICPSPEVDRYRNKVQFPVGLDKTVTPDMDMSEFQDGATYTQIKDYVLEHSGLKVSNLYISQIKRKCGIEVGKNYNLPKSEDSRQPQCPPEKEKAIREAMKYFGMI